MVTKVIQIQETEDMSSKSGLKSHPEHLEVLSFCGPASEQSPCFVFYVRKNSISSAHSSIYLNKNQAIILAESILNRVAELEERKPVDNSGGTTEVTPVPPALQASIEQILKEKGLIL